MECQIEYEGEVASVMLNNGRKLIVDKDFDWILKDYHWCSHTIIRGENRHDLIQGYLITNSNIKRVPSRIIINVPRNMVVDHINHDRYDNRMCNLRICTISQNRQNMVKQTFGKTKYKGVYLINRLKDKPYKASVNYKKQNYFLGRFSSEEEAALAYDQKAKELYGEYANTNF